MRSCLPIPIARSQRLWPTPSRWRRALAWLALICSLLAPSSFSAEPVSKEYQLKAAFLYNFTKFVMEWPTNRFATKDSPITIGILGENPFGEELARVVQDRNVNGRSFLVKTLKDGSQSAQVDVLFVPRGQESLFQKECPALQTVGVLTVGESPAFAAAGGLINFTTEADKIRFEINLDAAEQSGFKFSSQLLKVAKIKRPPAP
jgi:hypothetical protein